MSEDAPSKASSRPPSEEELFYLAWGRETLKSNISTASTVLCQFITINVALLGGGAAYLNTTTIPSWVRIIILLSFLFGLVLAIFGVLPTSTEVNSYVPEEIKIHKSAALKSKRLFLRWAAGCTVLGLLVSAVAVSGIRVCF